MTRNALVRHLASCLTTLTPMCGSTTVFAIDGRAGSGKTSTARLLREELQCPLVSMEGLYPGWDGLEQGVALLASDVLAPLARGEAAQVPNYDWERGEFGQPRLLEPPPLLIVEGVGCGAKSSTEYLSYLVWLDCGEGVRQTRALSRPEDGTSFAEHWDDWAEQERLLLAGDRIFERASLMVTTTVNDEGT
ncbi:MAG: hypothetical protein NTZ03_13735 [Actinobacteria bacterium]|nr:hypothetical protein [Actinomycetota bacterium]